MPAPRPPHDIVTDEACLRFSRYQPRDAWRQLDDQLRGSIPAYEGHEGLIHAWLARRALGPTGEHVLATVWTSRAAHDQAFSVATLATAEQEASASVAEVTTELLPVRIHAVFPRGVPMTILRVFRGRTFPGQRAAYLAEARAGTMLDGERPDGPGALACAIDGDDGFLTVSVWPSWASIEACTGGDVRRPLTTRNRARIAWGAPVHYELVAVPTDADPAPYDPSHRAIVAEM
jgi:hypothetical protein